MDAKEKKPAGWREIIGTTIGVIFIVGVIAREVEIHKQVLLAVIAFPFVWVFEKIVEIGFWNIVGTVIVWSLAVWLINRIAHAYELLNGLSDDINDIKKKLGLHTFSRTPSQRDKEIREEIKDLIYKGEEPKGMGYTNKELKEYKYYIEYIKKDYSDKVTYCSNCDKFFDDILRDSCDTCKGGLFLAKAYFKRQAKTQSD